MNILRMLQSLPVYVVTGKTAKDSTDAAGYIAIKDEGTRGPNIDATSGLPITQITDITGLTAWKDYIPVMEYAGANPRWASSGYIPCKLASGAIFVPPATGKWNSADKSVNVTLSNSDLTGTFNGNANPHGARGLPVYTSGDKYFEVTFASWPTNVTSRGIGLALASQSLTGATFFGETNTAVAWRDHGYVRYNATNVIGDGTATLENGVVAGIRYDGTTLTIYRNGVNKGTYALANNSWYPLMWCNGSQTGSATINTGTSAFSYLPSGASAWG